MSAVFTIEKGEILVILIKRMILALLMVSLLFFSYFYYKNKGSNIIINNINISQMQMINAYMLDTKTTIKKINKLKIAVIDEPVDYLSPNLNIINQKNNSLGRRTNPDSHGTAVVSLLSASNTKSDDYQGLLPGANIYFYEMVDLDVQSLTTCIDNAINDNVNVINISLSTYKDEPSLRNSIERAIDKGIIIVASAGNDSSEKSTYPASYPLVISVSAIDGFYEIMSTSNYNRSIDVVAPGYSARTLNGMEVLNATSEAAVYVTCLAILLKDKYPNYSVEQIHAKILSSSNTFQSYWNGSIRTVNMIDFKKALD